MPRNLAHHRILMKRLTKHQQKRLIRNSVLFMAIAEPFMTLPQIYQVWIMRNAEGVSMATWGLYITAALVWLMYGVQLKDKPLIISGALWIAVDSAVFIGTLVV